MLPTFDNASGHGSNKKPPDKLVHLIFFTGKILSERQDRKARLV